MFIEAILLEEIFLDTEYFTDGEYEKAFTEFGGFRKKIVEKIYSILPTKPNLILDFLSGHGFFGAEMALKFPDARIIGTGLINDVSSFRQVRRSKSFPQKIWTNFAYIECDVTNLPLKSTSCDLVVNFLGLEDLNMTRDKTGVELALDEIYRVTKPDGLIQISYVDYGDAPEEVLAREIWENIGLNAIFYDRDDYISLLIKHHFLPIDEFEYRMHQKMTATQAREELLFACSEAPKVFSDFSVKALDFHNLWNKFSRPLQEHGMAFWSPIRIIISSKE